MICFTRQQLEDNAQRRRPGYAAAILAVATVTGERICVPPTDYVRLRREYQGAIPTTPVSHPASHPVPVKAKAGNLLRALWRWVRAGCPITEQATRRARQAICEACTHWRSAGNLGLGECQHPGCGCTRAKHWLATERCPAGKWPESARQLAFRALATWLKWRIRRAWKSPKIG